MTFGNIWSPDPLPVVGWMIEVPIRTPDLPANLWVHWSGISKDWRGFPPDIKNGDWHNASGVLVAPVAAGDSVLAGQACMGIAAAHREEQGLFDTDDWGMAVNGVGSLPSRVDGPGNVILPVSFATLGNCWPVALALVIDLLVLRPSSVPLNPVPYGQRPKRESWRDKIAQRTKFIDQLKSDSDRAKVLQQLLAELNEAASVEENKAAAASGLPRRAVVGLSMSLTSPIAPVWRPPDVTATAAPAKAAHRSRRKARD
jgi:hypothetical protein